MGKIILGAVLTAMAVFGWEAVSWTALGWHQNGFRAFRDESKVAEVIKANLTTSNERLQRIFSTDPELAFLRNPDGSVNQSALAAQEEAYVNGKSRTATPQQVTNQEVQRLLEEAERLRYGPWRAWACDLSASLLSIWSVHPKDCDNIPLTLYQPNHLTALFVVILC